MVGNTGRKCSSQGINVIGGGSQCMGNLYKALLSQKSRKFDLQIQQIVPTSAIEHNMWGLVVHIRCLLAKRLPDPPGCRGTRWRPLCGDGSHCGDHPVLLRPEEQLPGYRRKTTTHRDLVTISVLESRIWRKIVKVLDSGARQPETDRCFRADGGT